MLRGCAFLFFEDGVFLGERRGRYRGENSQWRDGRWQTPESGVTSTHKRVRGAAVAPGGGPADECDAWEVVDADDTANHASQVRARGRGFPEGRGTPHDWPTSIAPLPTGPLCQTIHIHDVSELGGGGPLSDKFS